MNRSISHKKGLLDLLAWLAVPFFVVNALILMIEIAPSSLARKHLLSIYRGKSWEQRRRENLYLLLEFVSGSLGAFLFFQIIKGNKQELNLLLSTLMPCSLIAPPILLSKLFAYYEKRLETRKK